MIDTDLMNNIPQPRQTNESLFIEYEDEKEFYTKTISLLSSPFASFYLSWKEMKIQKMFLMEATKKAVKQ